MSQTTLYTATLHLTRTPLYLKESPEISKITCPDQAATLAHHLIGSAPQEHLIVLALNTKNLITDVSTIHIGGTSSCFAETSNILRVPLIANAPQFILAHNHPSGDPNPSPEDIAITRTVAAAAQIMGMELLDHVIVTLDPRKFRSLRQTAATQSIFTQTYSWQ